MALDAYPWARAESSAKLNFYENAQELAQAKCHAMGERDTFGRMLMDQEVLDMHELAATGYFKDAILALGGSAGSMRIANTRLRAAEAVWQKACASHNIYAVVGVPVWFADAAPPERRHPWYNTALVVAPSGAKIHRQAPTHRSPRHI